MNKKALVILLMLVVFGVFSATAEAEGEKSAFLSASDGKGTIRFFWYVPIETWPEGGWRMSDEKGRVIKDQILPLNQEANAGLTENQIESVAELIDGIGEAKSEDPEDRELLSGMLAIMALSSFEKAKAFGLAWELTDVAPGPAQYQLIGLDKDKKPNGIRLTSTETDSAKATPLPAKPEDLKIVPDTEGVNLFWTPVPDSDVSPVSAYEIIRKTNETSSSRSFSVTTGMSWEAGQPVFIDTEAPVEQDITYQVFSIDCFGRKSLPASVTLFVPDMMTLEPPLNLSFKAGSKKIVLLWETSEQARPARFVVERAAGSNGLYQTLTPEGLTPSARKYTDKDVIQGIYYYYRVRSVGTDGTLGDPSSPVIARVENARDLRSPKNLSANVNPTLVVLSWEKSDDPVKGYIVERRSKGSDTWAKQNDSLVLPREYKDHFYPGTYGVFYYRVTAVGYDGRKSKSSKEISVELKDLSPPSRPAITSIDGRDGQVVLTFEPDKNDTKTKTFTLLRDLPSRKQGEIIQEGVSAKERQFVDTDVIPGQGYWYAVVALDAQGQESPMSEKHLVKVMAPSVPKPEKPSLKVVNEPFVHVRVSFKQPPEKLSVSLQRKDSMDEPWTTIIKGLTGTNEAVDTHPVESGSSWYRIVYHSINGPEGEPSEAVGVKQ